MTAALFSPFSLRSLTLSNRTVVSPMCQYTARDGLANDWHVMHVGNFAVSGWGLVIMEATGVEARGRITPGCLGLWSDDCEQAMAPVVSFCKDHGQAAVGIQLAHAGRKASSALPWLGGHPLPADDPQSWPTVAPSAIPIRDDAPMPQTLGPSDLDDVRDAFVAATRRADRLGFDLIELHGAHGYLLHEFLSPLSNQRDDQYGGSLENRMRFPLSVFDAVRAAWPKDKPLGIRLSASDWAPGGWDIEGTVALAKELEERGCDYIDVSSGGLTLAQKITLEPAYHMQFVDQIRPEVSVPLMVVGLIDTAQTAEAILAENRADLIALGRGALNDPRWPWHAAMALGADAVYPPQYLRCGPSLWQGEQTSR